MAKISHCENCLKVALCTTFTHSYRQAYYEYPDKSFLQLCKVAGYAALSCKDYQANKDERPQINATQSSVAHLA